nr:unnamed protein product [Spirometra erinaceieuropaei]
MSLVISLKEYNPLEGARPNSRGRTYSDSGIVVFKYGQISCEPQLQTPNTATSRRDLQWWDSWFYSDVCVLRLREENSSFTFGYTLFSTNQKRPNPDQKISADADGAQFVKKALVRDSVKNFSEIDVHDVDLKTLF